MVLIIHIKYYLKSQSSIERIRMNQILEMKYNNSIRIDQIIYLSATKIIYQDSLIQIKQSLQNNTLTQSQQIIMFTLIRTIGGGPKNRFKQDGYNLDLTYITPRIIAMSFPSVGFQSVYRNDLDEIVDFLHKKHGQNYMIVNVSNRKYEYEKFHGEVKDYFWPNHQTPQLKTLFLICSDVAEFLSKNQKNVVAFHCNHGKGRTGTAIISYLLYSGHFSDLKTTIQQYNSKRFSNSFYQIDIPCQVRYLEYFEALLRPQKINFDNIHPVRLIQIQTKGVGKNDRFFIRFLKVKEETRIGDDILLQHNRTFVDMKQLLIGDIKAEILVDKMILGLTKIAYINFNTYFREKIVQKINRKQLTQEQQLIYHQKITFNPNQIKTSWGYGELSLTFLLEEVKAKQFKGQKVYDYEMSEQLISQRQNFKIIDQVIKKRNNFL